MTTTTVPSQLEQFSIAITAGLNRLDLHKQKPIGLYEPASYLMNLGGKRMRPALVLAAYALFKDNFEAALPQALAVELFHNFTLAHDDIMDDAPYRRGKATIHTKWNLNTGILSGDLIMIKAYEELIKCPTNQLPEILKVFNQTAIDVCEGQQLDVDFETSNEVSIEDYLKMISLKTAALLDGSLKIGAMRADASAAEIALIGDFGMNLGIAFQLQDDILDVYGDPKRFGKQVGGDIIANKKTYLLLTALQLANTEQLNALHELLNQSINPEEKVEKTLSVFYAIGVKEHALNAMNSYYKKAEKALALIGVDEARKATLHTILNSLRVRDI